MPNQFSLAPADCRQMTAVEAAWVGAMVEGEGCIRIHPRTSRRHAAIQLRVANTDVETIATVLRLTGCGGVYAQKWHANSTKQAWSWEVNKTLTLQTLLPQLLPYLTGKRAKAQQALEVLYAA